MNLSGHIHFDDVDQVLMLNNFHLIFKNFANFIDIHRAARETYLMLKQSGL